MREHGQKVAAELSGIFRHRQMSQSLHLLEVPRFHQPRQFRRQRRRGGKIVLVRQQILLRLEIFTSIEDDPAGLRVTLATGGQTEVVTAAYVLGAIRPDDLNGRDRICFSSASCRR